jgi:hypothetical protein
MRVQLLVCVVCSLAVAAADAQATKTATFENFAAGTAFQPSFTDPLSSITFRNSTNPPLPGGFDINFSSTYFGGGNYLTSGGSGDGVLGTSFGFTADLPAVADNIQLDALYLTGSRANVTLEALNSSASVIAQQSGPVGISNAAFSLQVSSGQFDITTIRLLAGPGASACDNISITIAPEPATLWGPPLLGIWVFRRSRNG